MSLPKEYRWCIAASASVLVVTALAGGGLLVTTYYMLGLQLLPNPWWAAMLFSGAFAIIASGFWLERRVGQYVLYKLLLRRHAVIVLPGDLDGEDS